VGHASLHFNMPLGKVFGLLIERFAMVEVKIKVEAFWKEIKDDYAEVYFCVKGLSDRQHTIIVPTDMINKLNASAIFNLASGSDASMFVTLGGLTSKIGTIKSSVNGSTRLIILAR